MEQVLKSYLEHICGVKNVKESEPMCNHTTFKIGGNARFFVQVKTKEILVKLISALDFINHPYRVIGGGSNLLASDDGFDGVIIKTAFKEIVDNGNFVYADAGTSLALLSKYARERNLSGLEFAAQIPGTVGGAVFMNAGANGDSMSDTVAIVDVLCDSKIISLDAGSCKFSYRKSVFQSKRNFLILGAYFFLKQGTLKQIPPRNNQPKEPSAGSVFKNPKDMSAGKLIDDLGLKGTRTGGAAISEKHANFIVNRGNASCKDVLKLIRLVRKKVRDAHGITLKTEIEFLK